MHFPRTTPAAPTDAGHGGNVGAGRVMEWIDKAGYACAVGWSGRYCVTAYVGNVTFTRPVAAGDLVEARARIVSTGRSSMNVLVAVASGDPRDRRAERTTECLMVFVAVDETGHSTAVASWAPTTPEESALHLDALRHAVMRKEIEAAMADQTTTTTSDSRHLVDLGVGTPASKTWARSGHSTRPYLTGFSGSPPDKAEGAPVSVSADRSPS